MSETVEYRHSSNSCKAPLSELTGMLPDGWEERVSKSTGRIYFYNRFTGQSAWEVPSNAESRSASTVLLHQQRLAAHSRYQHLSDRPHSSMNMSDYAMYARNLHASQLQALDSPQMSWLKDHGVGNLHHPPNLMQRPPAYSDGGREREFLFESSHPPRAASMAPESHHPPNLMQRPPAYSDGGREREFLFESSHPPRAASMAPESVHYTVRLQPNAHSLQPSRVFSLETDHPAAAPHRPSSYASANPHGHRSSASDPMPALSPRERFDSSDFGEARAAARVRDIANRLPQDHAMPTSIGQLMKNLEIVKAEKGVRSPAVTPQQMELERLRKELQEREDEIVHLRLLNKDRTEALKAMRSVNDHRATLPGYSRASAGGVVGGSESNVTAVGGLLKCKGGPSRSTILTPDAKVEFGKRLLAASSGPLLAIADGGTDAWGSESLILAEDGARESSELQRRSDERRRSERIRAEVQGSPLRGDRERRVRKRKEIQGGRGFAAIEDERGETEEKEGREGQDAVRMGRGRREGDGGQRQSGGMAIEDRMRDAERNPSMGGGRGGGGRAIEDRKDLIGEGREGLVASEWEGSLAVEPRGSRKGGGSERESGREDTRRRGERETEGDREGDREREREREMAGSDGALVVYQKKKRSARDRQDRQERQSKQEDFSDWSIKQLKQELHRRELEWLLQGRGESMDYIYGPAMDQDAIIASRRKVSVDTSLRLNEETGALVIYDDRSRHKMRNFKLERAEYAVSPPKETHRRSKALEAQASKQLAKRFEGELAMRLSNAIRIGDITPSRKVNDAITSVSKDSLPTAKGRPAFTPIGHTPMEVVKLERARRRSPERRSRRSERRSPDRHSSPERRRSDWPASERARDRSELVDMSTQERRRSSERRSERRSPDRMASPERRRDDSRRETSLVVRERRPREDGRDDRVDAQMERRRSPERRSERRSPDRMASSERRDRRSPERHLSSSVRPGVPSYTECRLLLCDDSNRRWVVCSSSPPFTIGRSSKCDVVLSKRAHPSVSSMHLSIRYNSMQHAFEAQDTSTSGTQVNEHFLRNDVLILQLGDTLFVGGSVTGKRFKVDAISGGNDQLINAAQDAQGAKPYVGTAPSKVIWH